jgi:5-(aminomethyl)-3-furanmethanol phosphate kinase
VDITVIKVGGSLTQNPQKLRVLCDKLSELSKAQGLVVVAGGGEFADVARDLDCKFGLSAGASHRMAILGMDAYGFAIADLIKNSTVADTFEKATKILKNKKLAVFLPAKLMFTEDPLENSWQVTSDSIAAYIAGRLGAKKIVLLTDVDGIFDKNPKEHKDANLISQISAQELLRKNLRSSVDCALPQVLLEHKIPCFVVNGFFVDRVEAVLCGQDAVCTLITS